MRIEVVKAFLSKEECDLLNQWVNVGIISGWLDKGHHFQNSPTHMRTRFTDTRLTTRMYGQRFNTPPEILAISKKVRCFVGVDTYPLVFGEGKDGIVVSCTFSGGKLLDHVDLRKYHDLAILRCNVLTQKPEVGGILHIEGKPVETEVGDLHCYLASEHAHNVSTVGGNTPRIMWMFGACVPSEAWNNNTIKFGGNHELS